MAAKKTISLADVANVKEALSIKTLSDCSLLRDWIALKEGNISNIFIDILEIARLKLIENRTAWNEEELKMNFISIVLLASEIEVQNKIKLFYERPLRGTLRDYEFSVICDCIIGTPTDGGRPKAPYFFLQEYKKGKGDKYDPEAQMLVSMLLAQQQNNDGKPIYGAWVIGEIWYFATLVGNEYCLSKPFSAYESATLYQIVLILQDLKQRILGR